MNKIKFLFGLFVLALVVFTGCNDGDVNSGVIPGIAVDSSVLSAEGVWMLESGQTESVLTILTKSREWGAQVVEGESWCSVKEERNNGNRLVLTCTANPTLSSRTAVVLLGNGGVTQRIKVCQLGQTPFVRFDPEHPVLNVNDTSIVVTVFSNMQYVVSVPDSVSAWLQHTDEDLYVEDTTKINFHIAENPELTMRNAVVLFTCDTLEFQLPLTQLGNGAEVQVDETPRILEFDSTSLEIEVIHNVPYTITCVDEATNTTPNWLRPAPQTMKAVNLLTDKVRFILDKNLESTEARQATVTVKSEDGTIVRQFTVTQNGYHAAIRVDMAQRVLDWDDAELTLTVNSDVIYKVTVNYPENASSTSWLAYSSGIPTTATPGTVAESVLKFAVTENPGLDYREATVRVTHDTIVREIPVRQLGHVKLDILEPASKFFDLDFMEQDITVKVSANVSYTTTLPDWISLKSATKEASGDYDTVFVFTVSTNPANGSLRDESIVFNGNGKEVSVRVRQQQEMTYPGEYIPVSAEASPNVGTDWDISKTFDKDLSTNYDSEWGASAFQKTVMTYKMPAGMPSIDYLIFVTNYGENGATAVPKAFEILVATAANPQESDYVSTGSYSIPTLTGEQEYKIDLHHPVANPTYVRLVITESYNTFISCKELQFFGTAGQNVPYFKMETDIDKVPASGGNFTVSITSNKPYTIEVPEWITPVVQAQRTAALPPREEKVHEFTASAITSATGRVGKIIVKVEGEADRVLDVFQDMNRDQFSVSANTEDTGNETAQKILDGDLNTMWHSDWNHGFNLKTNGPAILTFDLTTPADLSKVIYYPRTVGVNGRWGQFEIWTKSTGESDYTKRADADNQQSQDTKTVDFTTVKNVVSIQIKVITGYGDHASGREIEFYR